MGVGEFLILAFITFGVYSIINKCIKIYENHLNFIESLEQDNKIDKLFKDDNFKDIEY